MIEEGYLDMEGRIKEMENALYTSDQGVIRIVDDVVGALINKGLLSYDDIGFEATKKMQSRQELRTTINDLRSILRDFKGNNER